MTQKAQILVVDDDIGILETIADILSARGYQVATAEDGFKAIERVRETPFDIVLMDMKMPGMNGVETYKELKKINPKTKVILMTAYAVDELVREALKEGAAAVLNKPLDINRLTKLLEEGKGRTVIMVVDDDLYFSEMLKDALEEKGHEVSTAGDGLEAIEMAKKSSYDLFLIDLKLPTIDGLQTYLAIREIDPQAAAIMMTGYRQEMSKLIEEAMANSAYTCLYKPFDLGEIMELIENINKDRDK